MALSNSQYDEIMREYEQLREASRHEAGDRRAEIYDRFPEYKAMEERVTDIAMETAAKYLEGDKDSIISMKAELARLDEAKKQVLIDGGYPVDYLAERHVCKDCGDTGYIDSKKCHCLNQRILKLLYKQSNIEEMLKRENFDTLTYDFYDDADLDMMKRIVSECKSYADNFGSSYENLMLYGSVGVGKTFLTNCIARQLIDSGYSVIYFTSIRLFDTLSKCVFNRDEEDDEYSDVLKDIYSCDLLIIDDLGTENVNSFISSRLFDVLNERDIRRKATVISTNLPIDRIAERYSERNFSRIFGTYKVLNPDISDIRIKKRRMRF